MSARHARPSRTRRILRLLPALGLAASLGAHAARAADDPCREWSAEHWSLTADVLRAWLDGAPQSELDESIFELLQREAWLTSCELDDDAARSQLVGWRLVGRAPDEYGAAVVESVLERAGFAPDLGHMFRRRAGGPRSAAR
jgi:hypothetical protein